MPSISEIENGQVRKGLHEISEGDSVGQLKLRMHACKTLTNRKNLDYTVLGNGRTVDVTELEVRILNGMWQKSTI